MRRENRKRGARARNYSLPVQRSCGAIVSEACPSIQEGIIVLENVISEFWPRTVHVFCPGRRKVLEDLLVGGGYLQEVEQKQTKGNVTQERRSSVVTQAGHKAANYRKQVGM